MDAFTRKADKRIAKLQRKARQEGANVVAVEPAVVMNALQSSCNPARTDAPTAGFGCGHSQASHPVTKGASENGSANLSVSRLPSAKPRLEVDDNLLAHTCKRSGRPRASAADKWAEASLGSSWNSREIPGLITLSQRMKKTKKRGPVCRLRSD
jgi:hypothetical protein